MDLILKSKIKNLLRKYNFRPTKRLGQNFLIDKKVLKKIVGVAELSPEDIVLEVGPGLGNLTKELAKKSKKVIAIEKDEKMVEILKEEFKDYNNVEIIQGDILEFINSKSQITNSKQIPNSNFQILKNYKLVANIPYYLTSHLIRKLLASKNQPKEMVLMVQKEVAERICAKPPNMNLLAISVQFYAKPKIISFVSKKSFWPKPKVDSAIIKITPNRCRGRASANKFFKIVRAGFSQPRKQLINNLSKGLKIDRMKTEKWILENGIKPSQRAETLSLENWRNLTESFKTIEKKVL